MHSPANICRYVPPNSAILPVQQTPHHAPPLFIRLILALPLVGIHLTLSRRGARFFDAALRTAVRESRLIRLQLKLLPTPAADLHRKSHCVLYDTTLRRRKYRKHQRILRNYSVARCVVVFNFGGLVIAPSEADNTSAAYLANTPVG